MEGHSIILGGDFNQSFEDNHGELFQLAQEFRLQDIMSRRHHGNLPATYIRGTKCIDLLLISDTIAHTVQKCGYLPYGELFQSDQNMWK